MRSERRPGQPRPPGEGDWRERQTRSGSDHAQQVTLGCPVGEDGTVGQEHTGVRRVRAARYDVAEGRAPVGYVVDDEVGHHVDRAAQPAYVRPTAQARVDVAVVDRVEAGVGAVVGLVERQHMHPAEESVQRAVEQPGEGRQGAAEPVGVRDQLDRASRSRHRNGARSSTAAGSATRGSPRSRHSSVSHLSDRMARNFAISSSPARRGS